MIRALALRDNEPEAYAKFMQLEDHASEAEKQMIWGFKKPRDIAKFVKRYFRVDDVTEDEITKISGIIMVKEIYITSRCLSSFIESKILISFNSHEEYRETSLT